MTKYSTLNTTPPDGLKPIPGFIGLYAITADGVVWRYERKARGVHGSMRRVAAGRVALFGATNRYLRAVLTNRRGRRVNVQIHCIVAKLFVQKPRRPGVKLMVNHIDLDRTNCRADNLEWLTRKENFAHWFASTQVQRAA